MYLCNVSDIKFLAYSTSPVFVHSAHYV